MMIVQAVLGGRAERTSLVATVPPGYAYSTDKGFFGRLFGFMVLWA